jgi:hypothetical protein
MESFTSVVDIRLAREVARRDYEDPKVDQMQSIEWMAAGSSTAAVSRITILVAAVKLNTEKIEYF